MCEQDLTGQNPDDLEDWVRALASDPCDTGHSQTSTGFSIDSLGAANWLIRKIKESRAYADRVRAWAQVEVERAEKDEARLLERFGNQLREWVVAELGHDPRRRSLALPAGAIGLRPQPPRLVV